jgi:glycosyltransferase involved in cell wall biosynthesis
MYDYSGDVAAEPERDLAGCSSPDGNASLAIPKGDRVSLILLSYNEAQTIECEARGFLQSVVDRLPGSELIVAEDGSTDGTTEILRRLSASTQGLVHLHADRRKGYARSLIDAVSHASNPYIFYSDTGFKFCPDDFWKVYERRAEFDLVSGQRVGRTDQCYRRVLTYGYNLLLRLIFRGEIRDADSGFKLFNRRVVEQVFPRLGFKDLVGSELVLRTIRAGLRYGEVAVDYQPRRGESRGLPPRRIPRTMALALRNLIALKREA